MKMTNVIQQKIQRESSIQKLVQKFHLEDSDYVDEDQAEVQQVVQSYSSNRYQPKMEWDMYD